MKERESEIILAIRNNIIIALSSTGPLRGRKEVRTFFDATADEMEIPVYVFPTRGRPKWTEVPSLSMVFDFSCGALKNKLELAFGLSDSNSSAFLHKQES